MKEKLKKLQEELNEKAILIAVSKFHPEKYIEEAYNLGQRDFGESRVQELILKDMSLRHLTDIRWHFIGHIQTNKVKQLLKIKNLYMIHSIDSIKVFDLLIKNATFDIKFFIEINTSNEDEKEGIKDLNQVLEIIKKSFGTHLKYEGLMTMGPIRTSNFEKDTKFCFTKLAKIASFIKKELSINSKLSMGMTSDYKIALECGSDYVRIGSKIFGDRE